MRFRRHLVSLLVLPLLCLPAAASAQSGGAALVASGDPAHETAAVSLPDFRMPRGDYRAPPGPVRNGLIAAVPLGRNLQFAVGRFAVPDISVRTEGADIRRRDRRIAAAGFSFRF